ncbi:hypothetical protein GCM10022205_38320 [Spinactinospora alkalitolerans]
MGASFSRVSSSAASIGFNPDRRGNGTDVSVLILDTSGILSPSLGVYGWGTPAAPTPAAENFTGSGSRGDGARLLGAAAPRPTTVACSQSPQHKPRRIALAESAAADSKET